MKLMHRIRHSVSIGPYVECVAWSRSETVQRQESDASVDVFFSYKQGREKRIAFSPLPYTLFVLHAMQFRVGAQTSLSRLSQGVALSVSRRETLELGRL